MPGFEGRHLDGHRLIPSSPPYRHGHDRPITVGWIIIMSVQPDHNSWIIMGHATPVTPTEYVWHAHTRYTRNTYMEAEGHKAKEDGRLHVYNRLKAMGWDRRLKGMVKCIAAEAGWPNGAGHWRLIMSTGTNELLSPISGQQQQQQQCLRQWIPLSINNNVTGSNGPPQSRTINTGVLGLNGSQWGRLGLNTECWGNRSRSVALEGQIVNVTSQVIEYLNVTRGHQIWQVPYRNNTITDTTECNNVEWDECCNGQQQQQSLLSPINNNVTELNITILIGPQMNSSLPNNKYQQQNTCNQGHWRSTKWVNNNEYPAPPTINRMGHFKYWTIIDNWQ